MKKVLICMLAAAAMLPSATVFAAGSYDAAQNQVTVDASAKKTVMIARNTGVKMTDDDIVYVGQVDSGFSGASAIFKLKAEPAVGFYTIMIGGDGYAADKKTFFIGKEAQFENNFADKTELTALKGIEAKDESNNTVTKAYVSADAVTLANVKSIVVKVGEQYVCQEPNTVTNDAGAVKLAVRLADIPAAAQDNVKVWISSTEISTKDLITE